MTSTTENLEKAAGELLRPEVPLRTRIRRALGAAVTDNFFLYAAKASRLLPLSHPRLHNVTVTTDLPYVEGSELPEHRLDVYRPRQAKGPLPIVLYLHGGGFRILSKDTHWVFGLLFARRGYLVVNVSYRLAPRHPFPAALEDVCRAYEWVVHNAERLGGDVRQLVVAGESAGANLATALAVCTSYRRPEPYARRVYDTGVQPRAVMPACGYLQISDPERFVRAKRISAFVADRLAEVTDAYFHGHRRASAEEVELADPLLILERGACPDRPLPPFFASCGTWDVLKADTRRLKEALDRLRVRCDARFYPGEPHAFHAFAFRANARRWWRDHYAFLDEVCRQLPTEEQARRASA